MIRTHVTVFLFLIGLGSAQSSLDLLNGPANAQSAGIGISLDALEKPTDLLNRPATTAELGVWNWVDGIQGASVGVTKERWYLSFQGMNAGEIEQRGDLPTEDPLSTFSYTLFHSGIATARELGPINVGLGVEYIYERTLNVSASALSLNLAASYALWDGLQTSAGIKGLGVSQDLDAQGSELPTEAWVDAEIDFQSLTLRAEINSGDFPFALGGSYTVLDRFQLMGGVQMEPADPDLKIHPSAGFSAAWDNFIFSYALYQFSHSLGARHFISLTWDY